MSRSLIVCAIDAGATNIVRVKSSGSSSCEITAFKTIGFGLDAFQGPKGRKAFEKLSGMLGKWGQEPLALALSPSSILTLPAWFPAGASKEKRESLGRVEAGYFLKNVEEWSWQTMPLTLGSARTDALEQYMIMFYPAEPGRSINEQLERRYRVESSGLHIEPIVRLTTGSREPMAVLELEAEYAAFYVSRAGKAETFRYWPVKNSNEREFFAITELGTSPVACVKVTGLAADQATVKRIAAGTDRTLEPLGLPQQVTISPEAKGCPHSTGVIRAVSTALMALSPLSAG